MDNDLTLGQLTDDVVRDLVGIGAAAGRPKFPLPEEGVPYAIVPNDHRLEDLSELIYNDFAERPHRVKASVAVNDAPSFLTYFNRFAGEHSTVFADEKAATVTGIIDYHERADLAAWKQHTVALKLEKSPEWRIWTEANGKKFNQADFALFLEDNSLNITKPAAATMLEVARTLQATTEAQFESGVRLQNGQQQLVYKEQINGTFGTQKQSIPEEFEIMLPVYLGSKPVAITARLRYRCNSGKLTFWYDLLRPDIPEREQFLVMLQAIAQGVGRTVINGRP